MKAAWIDAPGGLDAIRYGDWPDPTPGPNDIVVRIEMAALNHVDVFVRDGSFDPRVDFPLILGRDAVGTVVACGAAVTTVAPGDRVWSNCAGLFGVQGTFAEYACIPADRVFHLPAGADLQAAAASLHAGLTAVVGLEHKARVRPGEVVCITGGSGTVGLAAIRVARRLGARVIATARDAARARPCFDNGAESVILYATEPIADGIRRLAPDGVDVFWQGRPTFDLAEDLRHLRPRGRYVVIAGRTHGSDIDVRRFYVNEQSILGFAVSTLAMPDVRRASSSINDDLLAAGFRPPIAAVVPLSDVRRAYALIESRPDGKVLVRP